MNSTPTDFSTMNIADLIEVAEDALDRAEKAFLFARRCNHSVKAEPFAESPQ